jgi:glycerol-1-phosphate dehydrogenase [NAD(P)+]
MEVRSGALAEIGELLRREGFNLARVYVGTGSGPSNEFGRAVAERLQQSGIDATLETGLDGSLGAAATMAGSIIEHEVTLALAVGGGRIIDTMKLAAARSGIDLVTCPTTIAHDGISSPVASLTDRDCRRRSFAAAMPAGIVVDIDLVASAPERTLRSGVGDLASNLTAILDWQLADRHGTDRFDAFAAMIAENAALSILEIRSISDPGFHERLAKGLLLSGLAMAVAGTSRPCSGAEHLISHSLDEFGPSGLDTLHGEQVALGSLAAAAAHRSPLLGDLRELFDAIGLPAHPRELGIEMSAMHDAVVRAPSTRPDRFTILSTIEDDPDAAAAILRAAFDGPGLEAH